MDYIFIDGLAPDTTTITVADDAARHIRALRLREGESVGVLNGKGLVAKCSVAHDRTSTELIVVESVINPPPPTTILALGLLDHKDRFEFALEKAVELGVTHFIPLLTQYVQHRRATTDRWRLKVISAITQSGNSWLPIVAEPMSIEQAMNIAGSCDAIAIADVDGSALSGVSATSSIAVFVGPEGGFHSNEIQLLQHHAHAQLLRLSTLRLRAETAAIAAVALIGNLRS